MYSSIFTAVTNSTCEATPAQLCADLNPAIVLPIGAACLLLVTAVGVLACCCRNKSAKEEEKAFTNRAIP